MQWIKGLGLLVLIVVLASCKKDEKSSPCREVDSALAKTIPDIGGFMVDTNRIDPATWLGRPQEDGRLIQEPINLILIDSKSSSESEAISRLISAFSRAGFGPRYGHSDGYWGKIAGTLFGQQPAIQDHAFSDYMWVFSNNHARIFGPYVNEGTHFWIGSSSREKGIAHDYVSFEKSRSAMVEGLDGLADVENAGCFFLNNKLDDSNVSTGDHNGYASVIILN